METRKILALLFLTLGLVLLRPEVSEAAPLGTAFTYQGRLMDANGPADGLYDFEFRLYDAVEDGNQLDGTVDINDLAVIDGYFTVLLDFGSSVFNGDTRWLEIRVRPGDSDERHTILSPRQEVTATPYALQTRGIFVDNTLNVGIGTTSPVGKLHVDGGKAMSGDGGADLMFKAQDGGDAWLINTDGLPGGDIILLPGEGGDGLGTGSPGLEGNVGIGAMNPKARLSVGGDGYINTGVYGIASNYGVYGYADNYGVFGSSSNYGVYGMGSYSGVQGEDDDSGSIGRLGHDTYGVYGSGSVYGGYFLGKGYFSGNVGIGTTSPEAKLGIASPSSGAALGVGRASGQPSIKARSDADGGWLIMDSTGSGKAGVNYYHNADVILAKGGGNVGIGTSNIPAGVSLAVDGKILCEEVEVQLSEDWPDYVFEEDYELMPLEELAQYVRVQKHLPDVPTADEVASSGISLGQAQARALRKIEELTLYVVDLNERLAAVKQENNSLRKRIAVLEGSELEAAE